jgi:hypothetical protein
MRPLRTVPWSLDPEIRVAVAPGIATYEAGKEYEHGGLSPQECVAPVLTVSSKTKGKRTSIADVKWVGLRCKVRIEGGAEDVSVALRSKAADPDTALSAEKEPKGGAVSIPIENDEREGEDAVVVALDADGRVLARRATVVGG